MLPRIFLKPVAGVFKGAFRGAFKATVNRAATSPARASSRFYSQFRFQNLPQFPQQRGGYQYKSFRNSGPQINLLAYRRPILIFAIIAGGVYFTHLEKAPVSGRWRYMFMPKWIESKISAMGYRQVMAEFGSQLLPDNSPDVRMVRSVMKRIIAVSGLKDVDWEIYVVGGNHPPNAFVLPGGKVFVFQSILPICQNEDGLAAVLAHETAHQVCRHTAENLSKSPIYFLLGAIMYGITGSASLNDLIMNLGLRLPASRTMETEADYVGLMMMAKACFNPAAAVGLWQRMLKMEQDQGSMVPELLSTHPASSHRIENIRKLLPEAEHIRSEHCSGGWNSQIFAH